MIGTVYLDTTRRPLRLNPAFHSTVLPSAPSLTIGGEELQLLAERAVFRPAWRTLLIADAHFGKAASFRVAGLAVPGGTTTDTLERLSAAVRRTDARRIVFLGDFFHARQGRVPGTLGAVREWRTRNPRLEMLLVRGNHDRHAGDPPADLAIQVVNEPWPMDPFVLRHHPKPSAGGYVLAGHLHPAVRLRGPGRQRERRPCFLFGERVGILPAFGAFTGAASVSPGSGDRVFVVAEDEVVPM